MKLFLIISILLMSVACQDTNSNTDDKAKYGPVVINEADPNFQAAFKVIQNRCINCHSSSIHNHWASLTSNDDWLSQYMINKNSPTTSPLVQRIINTGGTSANMPIGGSALPPAEYDAITKWIKDME